MLAPLKRTQEKTPMIHVLAIITTKPGKRDEVLGLIDRLEASS